MNDTHPTAHGVLQTGDGARYVKQLVSHLGRRSRVESTGEETVIHLTVGSCALRTTDRALHLHAVGDDAEGLATVQRVVGGHLERFAQRHGLRVVWS
ncbi:DUF2218 domain-containing protein [Myceligenerans indicum]|uniref:DUF2218 domain-containing protein n=1 Tax=Myceligenerans indicum TaxID=2593663 RepID=A0ABS1LS95_9MICO|nr:DUF2218 domain-containing protein [Myceligenerans indicum]MBL0888347.1 DUF2218 domain-containing protein [Myceligenerans indicum]